MNHKNYVQAMDNLKSFNAESKIKVALRSYLANYLLQGEYEKTLCNIFQ